MRVFIRVPTGTDMSIAEKEYPDMWMDEDDYYEDNHQTWVNGSADYDEGDPDEWFTHDEAVAFMGFVEGAIPEASAWIEDNGEWAEGMIRCRDFSEYRTDENTKAEWKRTSNIYWKNHERGKKARGEE